VSGVEPPVLIVFNLSGASALKNSQWLFTASSQPARGHTKRKALFLVLKLNSMNGFNRFQFIVCFDKLSNL
jgi:hypothetical protein